MMRLQNIRKSVLGIPIWTDSLIIMSMNAPHKFQHPQLEGKLPALTLGFYYFLVESRELKAQPFL